MEFVQSICASRSNRTNDRIINKSEWLQ